MAKRCAVLKGLVGDDLVVIHMMTFVFKQYLKTTRCKEIRKNRKVFKIIPEDVLLLKMGLFHAW